MSEEAKNFTNGNDGNTSDWLVHMPGAEGAGASNHSRNHYSLHSLLTEEDRRDDLLVVSIWLLMLTYSLVSNVLILIGILRNTNMRMATSYWFIISLGICDIVMSLISLVHLVPATAFHSAYVEFHSYRNILMIFFYDLFWYTAVLQLGLMACNRFVSIVYPMEYKRMFSRKRSIAILFFGYFLGFLVSLPTLFPCCHTLWHSNYYITVYDPMDTWYKYVDMAVNSLSLILMIFSYAVIIYKVRESGRAMAKYQLTIRTRQQNALMNGLGVTGGAAVAGNGMVPSPCARMCSVRPPRSQVSKKEMRLFIQFFVVSLVFLLTWTTWQWLPHMSTSKWAFFAMTSLFFINNSVNPTVYLIFNSQLRRELHYLLCRQHAIAVNQQKKKRTNGFDYNKNAMKCNVMDDGSLRRVRENGHSNSQSSKTSTTDEQLERLHQKLLESTLTTDLTLTAL
ncbi:unnamed protein product, partial [Mesorhabditis belari]|uniref:G-protein coupled receptors family 1 profile domain-containing protein n=1 Tax=Mesorhabditis belari TaxID=2138241 RepID=A0AAF3J355_9BILA